MTIIALRQIFNCLKSFRLLGAAFTQKKSLVLCFRPHFRTLLVDLRDWFGRPWVYYLVIVTTGRTKTGDTLSPSWQKTKPLRACTPLRAVTIR
jgi:hypothetical protein